MPALLALGTHTPLYEPLWNALPPLRFPRVPERLLPIACLCARGARSRSPSPALSPASVPVVAPRSCSPTSPSSRSSPVGAPTRATPRTPPSPRAPGRLLELPVFRPETHYGSVYQLYALQAPRERPGGYSTTAPPAADRLARGCGRSPAGRGRRRRRFADLGIRYVAVHRGLYEQSAYVGAVCVPRAERALEAHGFRRLGGETGVPRAQARALRRAEVVRAVEPDRRASCRSASSSRAAPDAGRVELGAGVLDEDARATCGSRAARYGRGSIIAR